MAVHDSKQVLDDNSEDDDAPLVFRSSTASKQNQLSSGAKKASFQKHDGSLGRSASDQSGETSNPQRNKNSTAKVLSKKPSAVTLDSLAPKPDQSKHSLELGKVSGDMGTTHLSSPCNEVKNSDDSDDDRPLSFRRRTSSVPVQTMNSQKVNKQPSKDNLERKCTNDIILDGSCARTEHSDDSDDDKPLSSKFSTARVVNKSSPLHVMKPLEASGPTSSLLQRIKADTKNYLDDSEDEKPLVSRFQSRSGVAELKNSSNFDKEKPLTSKAEQNDSTKTDSRSEIKLVKVSNKRALDEGNNSMKSKTKKARVSDASVSVKAKHGPVVKKEVKTGDSDHIPISQRFKKVSLDKQASTKNVMKKTIKKVHKKTKKITKNSKYSKSLKVPPESGGGQKWTTLDHNGVIFPPPYKPHGIKMLYNGQPVDLTPEQEEVATMFAVMKDTDYATKPKFIENFMNDWRQILGKNHVIRKFELCDFTPIYEWHLREKEKKKQMSAEEKKALKEEKLKQEEKYMWAIVDGVKEKVGNFRVEPPGLFRGRGEHPKMGKLKRRIHPRDITINIGKGSPIPECPIPGERWKEVKHDNTVTWLAFWTDPINPKEFKYVFLAASSSLKGQSDKGKYEKARLLKDYIHNIRANYTKDFTSKDATKRQIAVATYLIDKLALRAGNEKDDDEADTVGCCTLKVENVLLVLPNKLQFDFLGKDSVRYFNTVEVELLVYKAIGEFQSARKHNGEKKGNGDDLFDMLDTNKLNAHLKELMPGLTAKVFRTYNASITLDEMLKRETKDGTLPEKIAVYQHANKEVAIICNHQRSISKSHDTQMSRLNEKIDDLKAQREELKVDLSRSRKGKPPSKDSEGKPKRNLSPEALEKKLAQIDAKIDKMELDKKIKEDLKTVALGTSKINYLDPRITVAWCKRHEVPIEKVI